jgi:hypothetical protein
MSVIWKFAISPGLNTLPQATRVLSIGLQKGKAMAWAEADQEHSGRVILDLVSTGGSVPYGRFVGTLIDLDGWFVGHAYASGEQP